ncbi:MULTISPECIES: Cas10/Cmr2 second palm domain-containing protein [unclassified Bradyrhizobium]|uniref:Cas10/Cmr2 second palm domain-containing protein n=1 Tax=unclassified Bradyrhizobium TaxID=2631580 RepID=UPI00291703DE|nr:MULTISPECIES: type III-B CRISPR-associated protein Cas10/Cmr2 [unclassified Bradyrhizobium]
MAEVNLHFHLGPVQGLISEARRTRDWWAGSFLLSWLVANAMAVVTEKFRGTIESPDVGLGRGSRVRQPNDPVLACAIDAMKPGYVPKDGPMLSTLPNHFVAALSSEKLAREAGKAAEQCIRERWVTLASAVRDMLFAPEHWQARPDDRERALRLWNRQIGSTSCTPMWEIYWVCAKAGQDGDALLDARKRWRWSRDAEGLPPVEGAICSMMGDWDEISGRSKLERTQRQDFWRHVRQRLVDVRYAGYARQPSDCLDLREDEMLSAPALVKRLFPLLAFDHPPDEADSLRRIIGWTPSIRVSYAVFQLHPENWWKDRLRRTFGLPPSPARTGFAQPSDASFDQNPIFWPSTSCIAATHWLADALERAPVETERFAEAIARVSPKYALAEQNLWVKRLKDAAAACRDKLEDPAILSVDGASLFASSLMKFDGSTDAITRAGSLLSALYRQVKSEPAPYYAVLKMDGDRMGELMTPELSQRLARFAQDLRGRAGQDVPDADLGLAARHNGILLYASADEMLALLPIEDALAAALAIRNEFARSTRGLRLSRPATISGAITFAHRQVPLRWVMQSNRVLLNKVAKEDAGRDALAIEILDRSGQLAEWAAPWNRVGDERAGGPETLLALVTDAIGPRPFLGSNQLLHDLDQQLETFTDGADDASTGTRIAAAKEYDRRYARPGGHGVARTAHERMANMLTRRILQQRAQEGNDAPVDDELIERVMQLCRIHGAVDGKHASWIAPMSLAGMKLLRFLSQNWRAQSAQPASMELTA